MAPLLSWRNPIIEVVDGVLSADECRAEIARMEAAGPAPALVHNATGANYLPEYRHNDRVMLDDEAFAHRLYEKVVAKVPARLGDWAPCGANERLRYYRYRPGDFFSPHRDGSFRRSDHEESLFTLIVYLNDGFVGGETWFLDEERAIEPKPGRALLFNHALVHEGRKVLEGVKYAVRSDVMYRRVA